MTFTLIVKRKPTGFIHILENDPSAVVLQHPSENRFSPPITFSYAHGNFEIKNVPYTTILNAINAIFYALYTSKYAKRALDATVEYAIYSFNIISDAISYAFYTSLEYAKYATNYISHTSQYVASSIFEYGSSFFGCLKNLLVKPNSCDANPNSSPNPTSDNGSSQDAALHWVACQGGLDLLGNRVGGTHPEQPSAPSDYSLSPAYSDVYPQKCALAEPSAPQLLDVDQNGQQSDAWNSWVWG